LSHPEKLNEVDLPAKQIDIGFTHLNTALKTVDNKDR
jgi:hypothetical protein